VWAEALAAQDDVRVTRGDDLLASASFEGTPT